MQRREFLRTAAAAGLVTPFAATLEGIERETVSGRLERRSLGKTGEKLSILGFGGIVVKGATAAEAERRVAEAVDVGVNYFDVAPSYGDAQARLGPALKPHRGKAFLACKTGERRKTGADAELENSLRQLETDHLDLYQFHGVEKLADVETIFGPGGAAETFVAARRAGKIRFIGFSAHSVEAALALMDRFAFDTILFPINFRTWHAGSFGPQVLERARARKMGILALKAMARRPWPKDAPRTNPKTWYEPLTEPDDALLGLRFTLSHPVTSAIPPGDENLFKMALRLGLQFRPLERAEAEALQQRAALEEPIFRYPSPRASA